MKKKAKIKLTPLHDRLQILQRQFIVSEKDLDELPTPSPLDIYFLDVAEKHGIDPLFDDGESD